VAVSLQLIDDTGSVSAYESLWHWEWCLVKITPVQKKFHLRVGHVSLLESPPHHNRFTALFPGPPGWAGARRELLTLWCKGRLTDAETLRLSGWVPLHLD